MNFEELNLIPQLILALKDLDFKSPTQIQEKSIPLILDKKNVLAISETGTGKTAAFILPIIQLIIEENKQSKNSDIKAIILAPTRELVTQIYENSIKYSKYTNLKTQFIHSGLDKKIQNEKLKENIDILIITPNKLLNLLKEKIINLKNLKYLVLDEADNIIKTGFKSDLNEILKHTPFKIQTILFSATISDEIEKLAKNIQKDHIKIKINQKIDINKIEQNVYFVLYSNKQKLLLDLLKKKEVKSAIIFTNSKNTSDNLVRFLTENNIKSQALHSAKSDIHRNRVINNIKNRKIKYLIATDLASRGLDIDNITHVINYEIPQKPEIYTHRIGRVGRGENSGTIFSLCSLEERNFFRKIEQQNNIKLKTHPYHSDVVKNAKPKEAKPQHKKIEHTINKKRLKAKFAKPSKKSKRL